MLKYLLLFLVFFVFEFATGWVRAFSVTVDVPVMFLKYMLLVWFLISRKKRKPVMVLVCGIAAIISIPVIGYIVDGKATAFTLPNGLSAILGMIYGVIISRKATIKGISILIPLIVASFSVWYIFGKGFDHWCQLIDGKTFSGKVKPANIDLSWKLYNKNNDTFTSNNYSGKIVYLDFWTTSCGVCFREFPDLEKLYLKYKNHPNVMVQAVNIPIDRDTAGMAFYMIEKNETYTFPVVIATDSMSKIFGVKFYPTVIILKDNKIMFRGRTALAEAALEDIIAGKH